MLARIVAALLVLAGAMLSAAPGHAQGRERILRFVSDITVERNGDLIVTETIRVYATGDVIKRGILRDFPTRYVTSNGTHIEVAFDVRSVTRDGTAENFSTERIANGTRVRIGSADRMVARGEHDYAITYRTTRQVGFFKDYDELYWNVTGTGWTFPIDQAEARITLPEAVPFGQTAVYTGPQGATGKNAEVVEQRPGRIVFRTTAPLGAREGLTVAASWQKGVVIPPTEAERWAVWALDNSPVALALAAIAAMLGYLFVGWRVAGRDPPAGTMVPLFSPPAGMSAAAVRYVDRMEMDNKTFTAAIVDIAVRGHAKLVEKKTEGMRLIPRTGGAALPAPEADMERKLFGKNESALDLDQKNHGAFERARSALQDGLSKAYLDKLFHQNRGWSWRGLLLAIVLCVAVVVSAFVAWGADEGASVLVGAAFFAPAMLLLAVFAAKGGSRNLIVLVASAFAALAALVVAAFGVASFVLSSSGFMHIVPAALPAVLVPLAASAFGWMKAHTKEGRAVADQIEGFRHYLGVAERDRLEALNPPQETAALFEKYLPYAIALDVENQWGQRFATVLAAAAAGATAQQLAGTDNTSWYQGSRDWSDWSSNPGGFASYLGEGLTQTIAAASVPPATTTSSTSSFGSSSDYSGGSSGGGSSGGGGGGGGGSGW
jgi:uncharacterized membrane protein YgcG